MSNSRRAVSWLLLGFAFLFMACLPIPFLSLGGSLSPTATPGPATITETAQVNTETLVPIAPTENVEAATATAEPRTPSSNDIITEAVMAKGTTGANKDPVGVTDSFSASQSIFHAVITISNAPSGTRVRVDWMVVDDGSPSDANTKMAEYELSSDGSRNLDFTFTPNSGSLPEGTYKADVYLNGEFDRSLGFSVGQAATNTGTSSVITHAVTASDVQGSNFDPVGITDTFPATQSVFHAVVTISSAPSGTRVRVAWIIVDDGNPANANTTLGDYELTSSGSRNLDFTFKPNAGYLPSGKYRAEIYLNGAFDQSLDFAVGQSQ